MTLYLGYIILLITASYVLLLAFQQYKRSRAFQANFDLKRRLLEEQVSGIIEKNSTQCQEVKAWSGWRKFRVDRVVAENDTIKSFYFLPHDGKAIAGFLPGQHLTFRLKVPGQSKPVIRCYSLSDSAEEDGYYRVSIKKQLAPPKSPDAPPGVSSCYFHDQLLEGDVLDVRAPGGKFYLDMTEKSPIVLIGGGIGLTPSLSMLNTLADVNSDRKIHLLYAMQNKDEQIMEAHFLAIEKKLKNFRFHRFFAFCEPEELNESVHQGYISCPTMRDIGIEFDADFYICGPPPMMNAIVGGLEGEGVSQDRIHFESFGPASVSKKSVPKVDGDKAKTFPITFSLSGKNVDWDPSQGSVLDAAESVGVDIQSGCRAGSCGTCLTAIQEGEVTYIDDAGVDIEKGSCLACIAVPKGPLKVHA